MRLDLVDEVLAAAAEELFENILYTPAGGSTPTLIEAAIFGIEPAADDVEFFSERVRVGTHSTRALKAKFPGLGKGAILNDGIAYRVLDSVPIGDGRREILIALEKV